MNDIIYVEDTPSLEAMCSTLRGCEWLAIDTEFIRERTYFSQLALVQIAGADHIYIVDPLGPDDLLPLLQLLETPGITKVFHAAAQDLEIFFHMRQRVPVPIFDTQVAAALLGFGENVGYAALVKKMLGVELDKSHTRTDWTKRPLSSAQIRYAADDVRYLGKLYPLLIEKLDQLGRRDWVSTELDRLQDPASYQPDPLGCWQRVKGSGKLRGKPLNTLKHLAAWRENLSINQNRPRRWVLSDDGLINLAVQCPADRESLSRVRMLDKSMVKRHGRALLEVIAKAEREPEAHWPAVDRTTKPTVREQATLDLLMAVVRLRAEEHQLSPGQITSRSEMLKLLRGDRELSLLSGWRLKVAGQAVLDTYLGRLQMICKHGCLSLQAG